MKITYKGNFYFLISLQVKRIVFVKNFDFRYRMDLYILGPKQI